MRRYVDTGMILDSVNPMISVEVLVERDLEDGRASLTGGDGRRGEEVLPDTEPPAKRMKGY